MQIVNVPLNDLIVADYNPRASTEKEEKQLEQSIREFGFVEPVVCNSAEGRKNVIIGGHFRARTARRLGMTEVPVCYIDIPDIQKERELNLRLNKNTGHFEMELLKTFEKDMLLDVGFESFEIDKLFLEIDLNDTEDVVPELPLEAQSKIGNIYKLGKHILMCGDSSNQEHLKLLMGNEMADMVFTDPPYNINYRGAGEHTSTTILNDNMTDTAFVRFLVDTLGAGKQFVKQGAGWYIFHDSKTQKQFEEAITEIGLEIKAQLIWNKPHAGLGMGDYRGKHEPFFYCYSKGNKAQFYGDRTHTTVLDFQKTEAQLITWAKKMKELESEGLTTIWTMKRDPVSDYKHPTQKSCELITYTIMNSSKMDDIVLDLFVGSGSAIVACERTGRRCYSMELDPRFVDVCIERYENLTGTPAILLNHSEEYIDLTDASHELGLPPEHLAPVGEFQPHT